MWVFYSCFRYQFYILKSTFCAIQGLMETKIEPVLFFLKKPDWQVILITFSGFHQWAVFVFCVCWHAKSKLISCILPNSNTSWQNYILQCVRSYTQPETELSNWLSCIYQNKWQKVQRVWTQELAYSSSQIGAYDQQVWEKSLEQADLNVRHKQIKVSPFWWVFPLHF